MIKFWKMEIASINTDITYNSSLRTAKLQTSNVFTNWDSHFMVSFQFKRTKDNNRRFWNCYCLIQDSSRAVLSGVSGKRSRTPGMMCILGGVKLLLLSPFLPHQKTISLLFPTKGPVQTTTYLTQP